MKNLIRATIFLSILFLIFRWQLFNHHPKPGLEYPGPLTPVVYENQKDVFAGDYVRLHGIISNCRYLLGIGYYELIDDEGYRISIIRNHYPPAQHQLIDVLVYVYPIARTDKPVTIQIEVKVPQRPLFSHQ